MGSISLGFCTSISDYLYSNAHKALADKINETYKGKSIFFTGHWGFQYYMEEYGFKALATDRMAIPQEAYIAITSQMARQPVHEMILRATYPEKLLKVQLRFPFSLMDTGLGAGFYIHYERPLPWIIGTGMVFQIRLQRGC